MSSEDGSTILKNWQRTGHAAVLRSALKGAKRLFEVRVKVLSVDESTLMLEGIDPPNEIETVDLSGAEIGVSESDERGVHITLSGGEHVFIREE
jgi:hypothetical protein